MFFIYICNVPMETSQQEMDEMKVKEKKEGERGTERDIKMMYLFERWLISD